jgi:hypothetical protein
MPPTAKHIPTHPMRHLHKAVIAHGAIHDDITTHAQREHAKRVEEHARMTASAGLAAPAKPPGA